MVKMAGHSIVVCVACLMILFATAAKTKDDKKYCCAPTQTTSAIIAAGGIGAAILAWFGMSLAISAIATCHRAMIAVCGAGAAILAWVAFAVAGFRPGGIALGSLTAWIQAQIGAFDAGSVCTALQSGGDTTSILVEAAVAGTLRTYFGFTCAPVPIVVLGYCCTPTWTTIAMMAAGGTGAALLAWFGIPFAIAAVGFGGGGVVAGSLAAWIQAQIGVVAAGSVFAALQAAGAAGIGVGALVAASTLVGTAAAGMLRAHFGFNCVQIQIGDSCGTG